MSDDADLSQSRMELEEEIRRKYQKPLGLEVEATGKCLNCFDPLPDNKRWCSPECHDDWNLRRRK